MSEDFSYRRARRRLPFAIVAAVPFTVGGCASLDPARDIDRAATLVETRSGVAIDWEAAWNDRGAIWDGASPLSADAAVRIALRNNREIRRRVESIAAARADFVQAHLLPNPMLSFLLKIPIDGMGGSGGMAAIVEDIAWLWRRPVAIDAAEAELRQSVLAVGDDALSLVAQVSRAHADVVLAERALAIQQENVELILRSFDLVERRYDVGEASRIDVNRIDLDDLQARLELRDRQRELDAARRRLLALLGRAADDAAWSSDGEIEPVIDDAMDITEEEVIALASAQRLDVAAAQASRIGAEAALELAKRGRAPDVSAGAGFDRELSDREMVTPQIAITPKLLDDNRAQIAKAEAMLRSAAIAEDGRRQASISEARDAWITLRAESAIVEDYEREILALADDNLELVRDSYEAGESDLTVLLEAQRQLNASRLAHLARLRAQVHALIELRRAVGGSLEPQPDVEEVFSSKEDQP